MKTIAITYKTENCLFVAFSNFLWFPHKTLEKRRVWASVHLVKIDCLIVRCNLLRNAKVYKARFLIRRKLQKKYLNYSTWLQQVAFENKSIKFPIAILFIRTLLSVQRSINKTPKNNIQTILNVEKKEIKSWVFNEKKIKRSQ